MAIQYARAPHVRSAVHGDRTVLLDLNRERYYSLDPVGTRVWALLGESLEVAAIIARLAEEFDAPVEQLATDIEAFLQRLVSDLKVVVSVAPAAQPSGFVCAATLFLTALALRTIGLRRSLALAQWLGRRAPVAAVPSSEFLAGVVRKVAVAAAFFPGRALCLEQSMAIYVCCCRSGVPVDLRIGAQPYPFAAHAWVEYRGELVGSSYDQVNKFVPLAEVV